VGQSSIDVTRRVFSCWLNTCVHLLKFPDSLCGQLLNSGYENSSAFRLGENRLSWRNHLNRPSLIERARPNHYRILTEHRSIKKVRVALQLREIVHEVPSSMKSL